MWCFVPRREPKNGINSWTISNAWNITFKGATKFYVMHYLHVAIILFSTGLYKSILYHSGYVTSPYVFSIKAPFLSSLLHNLTNLAFEFIFILKRIFCLPQWTFIFLNWGSLHATLNSLYEAWSYKKRSTKNITRYRKSV